MSRLRAFPARAKAACAVLLVALSAGACDEDGKTVPARCADPPLPLFDIVHAGAPSDDNARFNHHGDPGMPPPCVTEVGHSISQVGTAGSATAAGSSSAGNNNAGTTNTAGQTGSQGGADAGAGGAGAGGADAGAGGA